MGYRKGKGNSASPDVTGMTPTRWLLLAISLIIGGVPDVAFFDVIEALAQKRPNDPVFLGFLLFIVFGACASSVFFILDALIVKKKPIKW